jgi:formylmethanofuran dehydrogenase subunit D
MYLLGNLIQIDNEKDIRSDDIQWLYEKAVEMSEVSDEDCFGIWANEGDDLVAIAHAGELFLKAK